MSDYTVIVAHRDEGAELKRTLKNVETTQKHARILAVEDKAGAGPGPTRHAGLMKTRAKTVIVIDGHMRFDPGALDNLADWAAAHPGYVGCLLCNHNEKLEKMEKPYAGAYILETGGEYALEAKWNPKEHGVGETECVMGACYGFTREWYFDAGAPLSIGRGWGCDEQLLSLSAGKSFVLPWECYHLCRNTAPSYRNTKEELSRIWWTRYAMLKFLKRPELMKYNDCKTPYGRPAEFRDKPAPSPEPPRRTSLPLVRIDGEHCPHCSRTFPVREFRVTHTYNFNHRRVVCPACGKPHMES